MAIRNVLLGGTDWTSENPSSADMNDTNNSIINFSVKSFVGEALNLIRQLQDRSVSFSSGGFDWFGDAYIDSNGRMNSVDTGDTNAVYDGDDDNYQVSGIFNETMYIVIEATSFGTWTNGTNDTYVIKLGDGTWGVWCDTGTDEVKRAQIHKSLWFGTNGSDQLIDDFTSVTAVKSTDSRDVGKRAHYVEIKAYEASGDYNGFYTGTFGETSTNTDCSTWSNLTFSDNATSKLMYWQVPSGTTLNSFNGVNGSSDHIGTDRSTDELDNPATCKLSVWTYSGSTSLASSIVLCVGDITWAQTGAFGTGGYVSNIDFYADDSIPDITAASILTSFDSLVYHNIPSGTFSSTISKSIGVPLIDDWETGNDIQYKLINTGGDDSGWLDYNEISTFTAFTAEPDQYIVKLVPKSSSPTAGYPSILGFAVKEV